MSDYKNIIGKTIKLVSSNLDNTQAEGQIWYNSTDGKFRDVIVSEAWSSGGNMINTRAYHASAGSVTSGLVFGGSGVSTYPNPITLTEEYNGSGFAAGGAMNVALAGLNGSGTQTAALAFGGFKPPSNTTADNTEEYNGSSWTAGGALGTGRFFLASGKSATQTAGLAFGGNPGYKTNTEEYDGSSWTAGGALNQGRNQFDGAGTQTAGLAIGGQHSPPFRQLTDVEEYDGSSWTSVTGIPTATEDNSASGLQTAALNYGGSAPSATANSFVYNGSTWASTPSMANARQNGAGTGTGSSSALATGGGPPSNGRQITEEYNKSANVITASAWASGGNMPEATSSVADGGTQTAAVKGAGQKNNPDSAPTSSAEYNGTSWTAGNTVPAPYGSVTGGTGTQTALITGGKGSGNTTTFEYDGTNWTTGGALGTGRYNGKNLGTQTAAAYCGGRVSPPTLNNVEEYDGSSWTSVTAMPIAMRNGGGFGIQTAGTVVSGFQGPSSPPVSPASSASRGVLGFDYDGTNWTTGTSSLIGGQGGGAAGTQTVAIFMAGENPSISAGSSINTSQRYDGTSYTTDAALARTRATNFGITSSRTAAVGNAAAVFGGTDPAASPNDTAATEEYSVGTTALNIKVISTS